MYVKFLSLYNLFIKYKGSFHVNYAISLVFYVPGAHGLV